MIPARIISIDDKLKVKYKDPQDHRIDIISDVENEMEIAEYKTHALIKIADNTIRLFEIGMSCFIEPTETGKCKIVKI